MLEVIKTSQPALAGFLFFWLPSVRWLPKFAAALTNLFYQKYGTQMTNNETCLTIWEKHSAQLQQIVPPEQLVFFNVKDGWEPLCKVRPIQPCLMIMLMSYGAGAQSTGPRHTFSKAQRCKGSRTTLQNSGRSRPDKMGHVLCRRLGHRMHHHSVVW